MEKNLDVIWHESSHKATDQTLECWKYSCILSPGPFQNIRGSQVWGSGLLGTSSFFNAHGCCDHEIWTRLWMGKDAESTQICDLFGIWPLGTLNADLDEYQQKLSLVCLISHSFLTLNLSIILWCVQAQDSDKPVHHSGLYNDPLLFYLLYPPFSLSNCMDKK